MLRLRGGGEGGMEEKKKKTRGSVSNGLIIPFNIQRRIRSEKRLVNDSYAHNLKEKLEE